MPATTVKKSRPPLHALIIRTLFYTRAIFGLCIMLDRSKKGVPLILILQRILASIWFVLYLISAMISQKLELVVELHIKSTIIVHVLPAFILIMLSVSTFLTLLFTHVFGGERMGIVREVLKEDSYLAPQNLSLHPRGANLIVAVAVLQIPYVTFWFLLSGPLDYYKSMTLYECIVGITPRFVSIFFLMDYFTASAVLLQQFIRNNDSLQQLQTKSLQSLQYPENETLFRQQLLKISHRHRELSKLVKRTNRIYSLQLLVNIGLQYGYLIAKGYITIYAILLSAEMEVKAKIVFVNFVHLVVNAATLVLLVEMSTRLCQEVSEERLLTEQSVYKTRKDGSEY